MSPTSLPESITSQLKELDDELLGYLEEELEYPLSELKKDIAAHYEKILLDRENTGQVEQSLQRQFTGFLTALKAAVKENPEAPMTYPMLRNRAASQESMETLIDTISAHRNEFYNSCQELIGKKIPQDDDKFYRLAADYKSKLRDLLAAEAHSRISGNSKLFRFAQPRLAKDLDDDFTRPLNEDKNVYTFITDLLAKHELGEPAAETPYTERSLDVVTGLEDIISALELELGELGVDNETLEELNLDAIMDHFGALEKEWQEEITLLTEDLHQIAGEIFDGLSDDVPADFLAQDAAGLIYQYATFESNEELDRHFMPDSDDDRELNEVSDLESALDEATLDNAAKTVLAGMGIAAVGAYVKNTTQANSIEDAGRPEEEKKHQSRFWRNTKLAFAAVTSVVGIAVAADVLLTGGIHTQRELNRLRGRNNDLFR